MSAPGKTDPLSADYGQDARERHSPTSDNCLGRAFKWADVVVELNAEQRALVSGVFERLPDDGSGVIIAQVFDGGTRAELESYEGKGGPRVFVCVRLTVGAQALAIVAASLDDATP